MTGRWIFSRRLVMEWIEACSREAMKPKPTKSEPGVEPHHLIISGAGDLLLQILLREFNRRHPSMLATSATLGSQAGIQAVRDGRAHVSGIHLLDPASSEYNRSQVASVFTRQRAFLATLAHREEGMILPRGNPRGVSSFADVVRQRLRFANREPGTGVRVLVDHLLSGYKLGKRGLPGYETELFTHLEVATAVAEGRADVGVGTLGPASPHISHLFVARGWRLCKIKVFAKASGRRRVETRRGRETRIRLEIARYPHSQQKKCEICGLEVWVWISCT